MNEQDIRRIADQFGVKVEYDVNPFMQLVTFTIISDDPDKSRAVQRLIESIRPKEIQFKYKYKGLHSQAARAQEQEAFYTERAIKTFEKPPLGAYPRFLFEEQLAMTIVHRKAHLEETIKRYEEAGREPNQKWIDELNDIENCRTREMKMESLLIRAKQMASKYLSLNWLEDYEELKRQGVIKE